MARPPSRARRRLKSPLFTTLVAGAIGLLAGKMRPEAAQKRADDAAYNAEVRKYKLIKMKAAAGTDEFQLVRQKVNLGITVTLVVVTIVFLSLGSDSTIPWVAGGGSVASGVVNLVEVRLRKRDDDQ